jgi:ParB family chromosome partitioning protein
MAKTFAPRTKKNERNSINFEDLLGKKVFAHSDKLLLKDAKLDEVYLKDIKVREQVRTKFNDSSIKELAENIKANGLIQPLVLHRDRQGHLTLICGERRFRAMSSIQMEQAPCFVLENKTSEELMAIQFSENSSRENLHYIDKADGIYNYHQATGSSERKIQAALGISKSEVHRGLIIAKLPESLKEAAKNYDIEKYVLVELALLPSCPAKKHLQEMITKGQLTKRSQLAKELKKFEIPNNLKANKKIVETILDDESMTSEDIRKLIEKKKKNQFKLDEKTKKAILSLLDH